MWMNERWSRARASIWSRLLDQREKMGKNSVRPYHPIILYTLTSASSPWRLLLYHTAYLIGLMLIPSLQYIVQPLWIYTVFYIPDTSIWRYAWAVRAYHCCLQKAWFTGVRGFAYMKMYWYRKPLKGVIFIWARVHLAVGVSISQMTVWMEQYQTAYWTDGVKNIRDCACVTDVTVFQWWVEQTKSSLEGGFCTQTACMASLCNMQVCRAPDSWRVRGSFCSPQP